jgi:energy-coupling factor transporter ATP-binding protein EcfA2
MISVIYGKKGSGKSKKLVDMANAEVAEAKGDIVFIDDDSRAIYDLKHEIRFVNCIDYLINNADKLYGFISGMMAQDYDISSIYIDGIKNILEKGISTLKGFFADLDRITAEYNISVIMVISGNDDQLPDFIKQYIV